MRTRRALDHRNIVKFERFFEDDTNVYIVLELCDNHSMMGTAITGGGTTSFS